MSTTNPLFSLGEMPHDGNMTVYRKLFMFDVAE